MRSRHVIPVCALAAALAAGCESERLHSPEKIPGQLLGGYEQSVSGDLADVDLESRTFTLSSRDRVQTFAFTPATEVVGAPGPQALSNREGTMTTVHYREEHGSRIALRIVLQ